VGPDDPRGVRCRTEHSIPGPRTRFSKLNNRGKLTPNDAQREQTNRLYEAQALANRERAHASQEAFDKALLTLSAGALGVSLAFIKDVAPLSTAICLNFLFWSWGLLCGSIVLMLFSFIASHQAFEHQTKITHSEYFADEKRPRFWAHVTRCATYLAGGCFVVALILTLVFAVQNVKHTSAIIKTNQKDSVVGIGRAVDPPSQNQNKQ